MVSANQIREMVSEYLHGVVDLEAFSKRFAVVFDNIEDSGEAKAIELSYQIESHLADVSAGFATEPVLREKLAPCTVIVKIEPAFRAPESTVLREGVGSALNLAELSYA